MTVNVHESGLLAARLVRDPLVGSFSIGWFKGNYDKTVSRQWGCPVNVLERQRGPAQQGTNGMRPVAQTHTTSPGQPTRPPPARIPRHEPAAQPTQANNAEYRSIVRDSITWSFDNIDIRDS